MMILLLGYFAIAILCYGFLLGDRQYEVDHDWIWSNSPVDADDYGMALVYGLVPLCWPTALVTALGHLLAGHGVPFTLRLRPSRYGK